MKFDKEFIRKLLFAIIGSSLLAIGIGLTVVINIGVSSVECVTTGLHILTNISVGTITALLPVFFMILALIIYPKNVGINTIIFILISKFPVDLVVKYCPQFGSYPIKIIMFFIACAILALGSEFSISSKLGASGYDAFTMAVGKLFEHKIKYVYIRWACDISLVIIGYLLGGDVGIGTIISVVVIGPFMKMWEKLLFKKYND